MLPEGIKSPLPVNIACGGRPSLFARFSCLLNTRQQKQKAAFLATEYSSQLNNLNQVF